MSYSHIEPELLLVSPVTQFLVLQSCWKSVDKRSDSSTAAEKNTGAAADIGSVFDAAYRQ